jgi:hypothetical protein
MSSQAYIFNPTERTLAANGDGFSVPRLTTAGRTSLTLTASDKGMMVYDVTLQELCIWNGSTWLIVTNTGGPSLYSGTGSPEGVVTAAAGSIYYDLATPGSPVQYVKGSGSGNTGWV